MWACRAPERVQCMCGDGGCSVSLRETAGKSLIDERETGPRSFVVLEQQCVSVESSGRGSIIVAL